MTGKLVWERDGRHWPNRDASHFVRADTLRWHVQLMGPQESHTPVVLLIHGTGASTHSWRTVMPLLAVRCRVVAIDLPGHGFTSTPDAASTARQFSLPGMAASLHALMQALDLRPDLVVGHSAGAALATRMCLDDLLAPKAVISFNGAFLPLGGVAGQLFSPAAKLMAASTFVPRLFAWHASTPAVVRRLIGSTGSVLDASGQALYAHLVRNPGHAAAALAMMAHWDLPQLERDLPRLTTPVCCAVGSNDRTVSPSQAHAMLALLPRNPLSTLFVLKDLGHLAHEERPDLAAGLTIQLAEKTGLLHVPATMATEPGR